MNKVYQQIETSQDYGRTEYAYHLIAKKAGITMSECRLLEENGRAHFMTKRFDRESGNIKHHMQTLCAMNHIDYKLKGINSYEQLFMTIRELSLGHEAEVETFRRMVFNVMARNCDDHTKNFSFLLRQGEAWDLVPAYDITFAYDLNRKWINQQLMSVNGKYLGFSVEDMFADAVRFGLAACLNLILEINSAHQCKQPHRVHHLEKCMFPQ